MKAIQVKFLAATNFKGARVKAWTEGGNQIILPYQYEVSRFADQAQDVAQALIYKMGWEVKISGIGQLPNGDLAITLQNK